MKAVLVGLLATSVGISNALAQPTPGNPRVECHTLPGGPGMKNLPVSTSDADQLGIRTSTTTIQVNVFQGSNPDGSVVQLDAAHEAICSFNLDERFAVSEPPSAKFAGGTANLNSEILTTVSPADVAHYHTNTGSMVFQLTYPANDVGIVNYKLTFRYIPNAKVKALAKKT